MTQTPSRTRAALPMLALAGLLTACAAVTPARPELPADLVAAESVDLRGLGAGTRGTTAVLGRSLSFQRGASRLSLFDELARSDRSTLQFRWGDGAPSALRAECRSVRRTHGAGVVEIVGRPLEIECRFEPDGSWLSMRETRASTLTLRSERQGRFVAGGTTWAVRSLHRPRNSALDVAEPLGYLVEDGGRAIAAVERQGTRATLHLPPAGDDRRRHVLPVLLALALLWDESGA